MQLPMAIVCMGAVEKPKEHAVDAELFAYLAEGGLEQAKALAQSTQVCCLCLA